MSKSKLTMHSKVRFEERVGYRENIEDKLRLAKKYGIKLADVPIKYVKQRKTLGYKKIYYDGIIFVFSHDNFYNLVTVYPEYDSVLQKLYLEKKDNINKDRIRKKKLTQMFTKINDKKYSIIFNGFKIVELKLDESNIYSFPKYKDYDKVKNIFNSISKYLIGKNIAIFGEIDISDCSKEEKIIYNEVMKIGYGKTITYKELADKISRYHFKISSRKLSYILNKCPILFYIPTHRVVRSNGQAGSFSNDVNLKKELLKIENNHPYTNVNNIENHNDFTNSMADLLEIYYAFD